MGNFLGSDEDVNVLSNCYYSCPLLRCYGCESSDYIFYTCLKEIHNAEGVSSREIKKI